MTRLYALAVRPSKKSQAVWNLSVRVDPEAEEAVTEFLATHFSRPVSSFANLETGATEVSAWFDKRPAWRKLDRTRLRDCLKRLRDSGSPISEPGLSVNQLCRRDWAEAWKRHFRPIRVGGSLLIKPGWSKARRRTREAVVILDPGLSFGTGQHPTTAFCLEQVVLHRPQHGRSRSFLDLGTGSGILTIAAAKLCYTSILAIDVDPQAVQMARHNARRNRVEGRIQLACRDLSKLPRRTKDRYSLICANLLATLLIKERERILARLAPGGTLVLAGILETEFETVRMAYESKGLALNTSRAVREWRSGAFVSRPR